ncbi:MAG: YgjP-like metallopeptidase domain-containing protein [Desulfobacterales bacterium]
MKTKRASKEDAVKVDGVGLIRLKRSRRARNMNLTVKPFSGVGVTIPRGVSLKQVEQFVVSKTEWIVKHLAQARQLERKRLHAASVIEETDAEEARKILVQKLKTLAERHGFKVGNVSVRKQKTRWGSCSVDNNISLNINLIHLPQQLMSYVILHELLHTRIKNHGRQFWKELDDLVGDARMLRSRLNEYSYLLLKI